MAETEVFYPKDVGEWRRWLEQHHQTKASVWMLSYKKASGKPSVTWSDAVEVALCFGWIDSKKIKIDAESSHQFFSRRKAKSTWSKINKDKITQLIASGQMVEAGLETIRVAKENGSWNLLDSVENLVVPEDLEQSLSSNAAAKEYFEGLSKSSKKAMLQWVTMARRPETRQQRINEITKLAAQGMKPKQF